MTIRQCFPCQLIIVDFNCTNKNFSCSKGFRFYIGIRSSQCFQYVKPKERNMLPHKFNAYVSEPQENLVTSTYETDDAD